MAVVDTGRVKETSFDAQNHMVRLAETWASRAACKQRRGRAGRVRAGQCYKLFSRSVEAKMAERPEPEMRRVPLEQLCLSVQAMGVRDVSAFLAGALTPPESTAVEGAMQVLSQMGAVADRELTALGRHLAMIPADLRCGKLLVYGATFGCLEAALTIAAVLTARSPFLAPRERTEERRAEFHGLRSGFAPGQGDLVVDLRAYQQWSERRRALAPRALGEWCASHALAPQTLFDIASNRAQYLAALQEMGFVPAAYRSLDASRQSRHWNRHDGHDALVRALVAAAFHPQIARVQLPDKKFAALASGAVELDPEARDIRYYDRDAGRVFVHPGSTLFSAPASGRGAAAAQLAQPFPAGTAFVAYFSKLATTKLFVRDLTPFNASTLLLFGGGADALRLDTLGRGLVVDGWVRLRGWARIGVLVGRLRRLLDHVLDAWVDEPGAAPGAGASDGATMARDVVDVVRRLVELDGMDQ